MKVKEKADSSSLFAGLHVNASPRWKARKNKTRGWAGLGMGRRGDTERGDMSPRPGVSVSPCLRTFASRKDHSPVALPHRHPLAVEVFQQRDRIFARDARQIFKCRNIDGPVWFVADRICVELCPQTLE